MPPRFTAAGDAFLKTLTVCLALVVPFCTQALSFSNRYRSPRNPERAIRQSTKLIVLHTTEAGARSSLNKLCERGEAHYCIDEKGVAYRIVDRNREAFHAGRSMWNGKEECDSYSIGIEVVGHHDKPVTLAQLDAIRELVGMLQKEYKIDDAHVVCHSHVAYGAPNKWQKRNHRGRKRCGMLFAMPSVRQRLNLKSKPAYDPDVRARRLVVGDPYLERVLYGKVDTMASKIGRNVAAEEKDPDSILNFYRRCLALRKSSETLLTGTYREYQHWRGKVYLYERRLGEERILVICSFSHLPQLYRLPRGYGREKAELLLCNYPEAPTLGKLRPYEAQVYRWRG